ncbi:alpha/beta hydrolase-fold protein [Paenalcaligenes niemegkensis]|uniref:alpha/beta hydrolase-fold protein n=1 Tax=Paenalcaligenes niemegkensis TaxID=2895469 RepID=UPI001EE82211|nr:alpha/beta hydrolase-fold protein [Paenalcaligenes niemegkensis]MCQ9617588.1 alpha/beta hydrolase-fold protein [Paenalcaligenes niemegkensis]
MARRWRPPRPLLLLLDGDWLGADIQHISSAINRQQVHIATLGYGLSHAETAAQRAFDFSPKAPGREQVDPRVASWQCGGADAFSAFLANSVIGYLRSELNVEQQKTGIFGHSYGGLYCLYALLTQPALFDFYYAASPALWWHWPLIPELVSKSPSA